MLVITFSLSGISTELSTAIISSLLLIIVFPEIFSFSDSTNIERNVNIKILKSNNVFLFSTKTMLEILNYSSIFFL